MSEQYFKLAKKVTFNDNIEAEKEKLENNKCNPIQTLLEKGTDPSVHISKKQKTKFEADPDIAIEPKCTQAIAKLNFSKIKNLDQQDSDLEQVNADLDSVFETHMESEQKSGTKSLADQNENNFDELENGQLIKKSEDNFDMVTDTRNSEIIIGASKSAPMSWDDYRGTPEFDHYIGRLAASTKKDIEIQNSNSFSNSMNSLKFSDHCRMTLASHSKNNTEIQTSDFNTEIQNSCPEQPSIMTCSGQGGIPHTENAPANEKLALQTEDGNETQTSDFDSEFQNSCPEQPSIMTCSGKEGIPNTQKGLEAKQDYESRCLQSPSYNELSDKKRNAKSAKKLEISNRFFQIPEIHSRYNDMSQYRYKKFSSVPPSSGKEGIQNELKCALPQDGQEHQNELKCVIPQDGQEQKELKCVPPQDGPREPQIDKIVEYFKNLNKLGKMEEPKKPPRPFRQD
jgi:hypothetical protein